MKRRRLPAAAAWLALTLLAAGTAAAQGTLVSNTGETVNGGSKTVGHSSGSHWRRVQVFTTGDNSEGYTLSEVDVRLASNSGSNNDATTLRVSIYSVSSGNPDSSLYVFTNPSVFGNDDVNTFTAPPNATLDANTDYAVYLDTTSTDKRIFLRSTSTNNESSAESGWSIADASLWSSDGSTWTSDTDEMIVAIKGTAGASSSGPTITISGGSAVTEGRAAEFTVTASEAPSADLTVNLTVSESSGSDYVASGNEGSKTVTITASTTSATYSVSTEADTTNEPNGTVTVAVASGTGYTVGATSSASVTVNDDDPAAITGVEITSTPVVGDTYRRNENIDVTVTWDEDVTWDVSATNSNLRVRVNVGGTQKWALLVTGGATSGTARSLAFRYAVVMADADTDGVAVDALTTQVGTFLIDVLNSATLQDSAGVSADREHAGLSADSDHKVDGSVVTTAPAAPAAPTVAAAARTILSVSWSAPTTLGSASSITDYDLRYFAGTADPTDAADWIEEGEMGGPPNPGTGTSARITGLTEGTAYRVQVRAMGDLESPWSASASATPANQAPRVLEDNAAQTACVVKTDTSTAYEIRNAPAGTLFSQGPLSNRASDDTGEFPAGCASGDTEQHPIFDDPDGDALTVTFSHMPADNVALVGDTPQILENRVYFQQYVALRDTDHRVELTATDPDGLTATTFFLLRTGVYTGTSTPAFSETVSAKTYTVNQQITELVLPAASGGDFNVFNGENVFGYFYKVSGLPAGLSFDAAERKISGTPTATGGPTTVTYTADDDDNEATPNDTASLTFTVTVEATDSTAPAYESSAVDGSTLTMTWDENLSTSSVPAKTAFTVKVGGTAVDLADTGAVAIAGRTVTLTLASAVTSTSMVTVSYTKPTGTGAMPLEDAAGNDVADLADKEVTNNTSFPGICDRTAEVETALLAAVSKTDCMAVIETDLTGLTGTLDLSSDGITSLKSGDFSSLTSVTTLRLNGNALSTLPSGVFDGLTALTTLRLDENTLSSLPSGVFDGLTSLATLNLYSNALSTLPANVFDGLTALVTLDLSTNSLSSLPSGVFDGLTALTTLRLEENSLSSLPSDVFDEPTALTTLSLDGNSLGTLPSDVFDGPTALTTLSLSGNSLSSLPSDVFDGPTSLTTLHLDGNSLSSLPSDVFDGPSSLTTLHLDENSLGSLPAGLFDGLTSLTTLRLTGNPGAPFPLTLDLERTDGALEAASPATMKVTVREGAPHALTVPLSVTDGTAPASASVSAGGLESATFTVTKSADTQSAKVTLGTLPSPASGFDGIRYAAADDLPLTLFDMTAPTLESASVNGATLTLTYDEALDEDSEPAASAFTVKGAGEDQTPTGVSVAGMAVTLTLERAASHGDTVTATYAVPSADPIQDTTGNDAAGFEDEEVINATPDPSAGGPPAAQPPSEGEVSRSGNTVTLTFAEELDETSVPAPSDFTVTLEAASSASSASSGSSVASPQTENHRVTEVSVEGSALELTISPPVPAGRSFTVRYAPDAASPPLRTTSGTRVGAFTTTVAGRDEPPQAPSEPPAFGPDAPSVLEVAENTAAGGVVGTVAATASDDVALTYTLAGADGGLFAIDDGGQITVGAETSLDFERRETYEVSVTASAGGAEASREVTIQVLDVDEPPEAPEAPSVVGSSPSSVEVEWTAPDTAGKPPLTDYDVRWFEGGADPPDEADWIEPGEDGGHDHVGTATSATIAGLARNTAYRVQVRAANDEGTSGWSASGGGSTGDHPLTFGPDAPSVLEVAENTGAGGVVGTVAATASDDVAPTYTLAGADGGLFAIDDGGRITVGADTSLDFERRETYEVSVTASAGGAEVSREVTIRVLDVDEPPAAPGAPSVVAASPSSVELSWSAPPNTGPPIDDYDVEYRRAGDDGWSVWEHGDAATSATVTGLDPATDYEARVRASNAEGAGPWSAAGHGRTEFPGSAPVADAGADLEADPGEGVTLNGSGSSDADGDALIFAWTQTGGVPVTLEGADTASPSFTAPQAAGALTFSLTVNDGYRDGEADEVIVTVRDLAPSFDGARINTRRYMLDRTIEPWTLPEASGGNGALTYSLAPVPAGLSFDDSSRRLSGTPTAEGRFALTYAAEDADGDRATLEFAVRVFGNRPPTADAGEDTEADPGERVTLDGTGSSDPDGDPLAYEWLQTGGAVVALEESLTARAAFVAPQQPGTLSFSLTVKDAELTSEPDHVSVRVRDLAPSFGGATIDRPSLVQGEAIAPLVLPEASGGNGALTYSLRSTPAGLAGLVFDPVSRTLSGTPVEVGVHTFTYRVEDADANRGDGDAALILFRLTVERPTAARREVLKPTLAAVGTATLNSAVDTIGSRFNGAGGQGSQLTLGGLRLAGGMGRARPGIGGGMLPGGGLAHGGGLGFDGGLAPGGGVSPDGGMSFGGGPPAGGGPGAGQPGLWDRADSLLLGTSFEWSLAGSPQEAAGDEASLEGRPLRWSLWGRAGVVSFDGRPDQGSRYGGELRTGYIGIDADAGRWLAGVALARSWSDSDYSFGGGEADFERGRLETTLTAVLPYGRWKLSEKSEAWGVLGMGRGEAAHVAGDALDHRETSDLSMWMAAGGLRHELASRRGYDLALRADGGLARLETADGAQDVDGLDAGSWRARVGLEASRGWLVGENLLTPFVELAGRYDGGDAASGAGLELAGGARYGAARFQLEARGRVLALHSDSGYREKGLSLTAVMNPREDGSGLSLAFGPRWGAGTGGAETLWRDHMPRPRTGGHAPAAGMDAALGYGLPMLPRLGGVLTPFAEGRFSGGARQYRLGARFGVAPIQLNAELAAERGESAFRPPDDRFGFLLRWSFGGRRGDRGLPEAPGPDSEAPGRR